jgi:hypothetical protein
MVPVRSTRIKRTFEISIVLKAFFLCFSYNSDSHSLLSIIRQMKTGPVQCGSVFLKSESNVKTRIIGRER